MTFSIYQLKPQFQRLLSPLVSFLQRAGVTPNQITVFTMICSVSLGIALALAPTMRALWMAFPVFMLLRMALNALDGMLANHTGNKTPLGALLNELSDQVSDAALFLPFALLPGVHAPLVVVVVVCALLAEFTGVLAHAVGMPRRFDGPMGKSDRAAVFGLLALLLVLSVSGVWLNALLGVTLLLSLWTIKNRFNRALQALAANRIAPPKP